MDLQDMPRELLAKKIRFITDTRDLLNIMRTSRFMKEIVETYATTIATHRKETIDVDTLKRWPNVETCLVPVEVNGVSDVCKLTSLRRLRYSKCLIRNKVQEDYIKLAGRNRVIPQERFVELMKIDAFLIDCASAYLESRRGERHAVTFRDSGLIGKVAFGPGVLKFTPDDWPVNWSENLNTFVKLYDKNMFGRPIEKLVLLDELLPAPGKEATKWPKGLKHVKTLHLYCLSTLETVCLNRAKSLFPALEKLVAKVMDATGVDPDVWDPDDFDVPFDVYLKMPINAEHLLPIVAMENVKELWLDVNDADSEEVAALPPEQLAKVRFGMGSYPEKTFGIS